MSSALTMDVLSLVVAGWALAGFLFQWREARRLKARCGEAAVAAQSWQRKYEALVEDVRRRAAEPQAVMVEASAPPGLIKARSSAEVRRRLEESDGRG